MQNLKIFEPQNCRIELARSKPCPKVIAKCLIHMSNFRTPPFRSDRPIRLVRSVSEVLPSPQSSRLRFDQQTGKNETASKVPRAHISPCILVRITLHYCITTLLHHCICIPTSISLYITRNTSEQIRTRSRIRMEVDERYTEEKPSRSER